MLVDQLHLAHLHFADCPAWALAFDYLQSLSEDSPEGKTELMGDDLFGQVQVYTTKPQAECVLEAHQRYLDIQVLLAGQEWLDVYKPAGLVIKTPFDASKDVAFYQHPAEGDASENLVAKLLLQPGTFALLLPTDVHMPQKQVDGPAEVKKVVVKVDRRLLGF